MGKRVREGGKIERRNEIHKDAKKNKASRNLFCLKARERTVRQMRAGLETAAERKAVAQRCL